MSKLKLKVIPSQFSTLVSKIENIASIDDTIKIRIDNKHILIYSMLGGSNVMLAFKNFLLPTSQFFEGLEDIEHKIDIIIPNTKKFVKNLAFIRDMDKISFDIVYKEAPDDDSVYIVRSLQISSGKFKINWLGGEPFAVRDIDKNALAKRLDVKDRRWTFNINVNDFLDIKKLSSINSERIINMDVNKGIVTMSETSAWELEVDTIDANRNASLILNKRFLGCINDKKDVIEFSIFDNFMLIKDEESNLMLSFEQTFEDEE